MAARLSHRYIAERFLPDKAIDVMDEAASNLCIQSDSKPADLDKADRQIIQLKIEQAALQKENAKASEKRLSAIAGELASLEQRSAELTAAWDGVKARMAEVGRLQQQLEDQEPGSESDLTVGADSEEPLASALAAAAMTATRRCIEAKAAAAAATAAPALPSQKEKQQPQQPVYT